MKGRRKDPITNRGEKKKIRSFYHPEKYRRMKRRGPCAPICRKKNEDSPVIFIIIRINVLLVKERKEKKKRLNMPVE